MSTLQHTKPRRANQSMTEESDLPGTYKSNVGCDAIDEPCTNRSAGLPSGEPTNFSHIKRRTPSLCVQCSTPVTGVSPGTASRAGDDASSLVRTRGDPLTSLIWVGAIQVSHRAARAGRLSLRAPR